MTARRRYVRVSLRHGEFATADGACLGVVAESGRRATVSWLEAAGGVLVTGQDAEEVTRTGLDIATAAILHRKTVLIIDLTDGLTRDGQGRRRGGSVAQTSVLRNVTSASAEVDAPVGVFGAGSCYEPFSAAGPAEASSLLLSMTDWTQGHARRAFCADYVTAALEVIATSVTAREQYDILDDLVALLRPGALEARAARAVDPRLRRRVAALAGQLSADPSVTTGMAEQLSWLRRCPVADALRGPPDGAEAIDIAMALARRQVVLFPIDRHQHGAAALMIARLVIADLSRALGDRSGVPADCLIWINGCDALEDGRLATAIAFGSQAGVPTIVSTAAGSAGAALAGHVNVVMVRGGPPRGLTGLERPGDAGEGLLREQNHPVLPAALLNADRPDELSVRVCTPVRRLLVGCRVVR
ncbi:MAG: hypothetical protein ACTHJW_17940 [Streptosporangiaceae bacterium]